MPILNKGLLGSQYLNLISSVGESVPDNTIRMFIYTDVFRWSMINNTADYTVDYGDGNTYSGTPSGAVRTVEHTYSAIGLYVVDFIFDDITDITRFQILDIGTGEYVQSFVNLDTATALSYLALNNTDLQQETVNVAGVGMTSIDFLGTDVKNLNLSGVTSNAGSLALSIRLMPELLNLVFPTITGNYASCLLNGNPKITEYDLSGEGSYGATVYRFQDCDLLETITFSSSSTTQTTSEFTCDNLPNLAGVLDLSRFGGFGGTFSVRDTSVTAINFPSTFEASTINNTAVLLNGNELIEELDLTAFGSRFGGLFRIYGCILLDTLSLPTSSRSVSVEAYDLDSLLALDLSSLTGLGGACRFNNSAIQTVTFPTTHGTAALFTLLYGYGCDITGSLDLTPLANNLAGIVSFYSNPNMTAVTFPSCSNTITQLLFSSCSLTAFDITPLTGTNNNISISLQNNLLTAAAVNELLVDLDTKGWTNGTLTVSGTGNAAPDGTSGGFDGLTAKTNLVGKGWSITNN